MSLHAEDKKKFCDVFIDFVKYGSKTPVSYSDADMILEKLDDGDYLSEEFEKYLIRKADEIVDLDEWDVWYDNLSLETITAKDFCYYDFPTKKILVTVGNEEALMRDMLNSATEFYKKCKRKIKPEDNLQVNVSFTAEGVFITFNSSPNVDNVNVKYNLTTRKVIDGYFSDMIEEFKAFFAKFNEAQGKDEVNTLHPYPTVYRGDDVIPGCATARGLYFTHEDLAYPKYGVNGKKSVPSSFSYGTLFKIIPPTTLEIV